MPHLTLEYSANLDRQLDMPALCRALKRTLMETGLFELGAIRVRAFAAGSYAIADELADNAFLDAVLRIGAGRSLSEKQAAGEALLTTLQAATATLFATPHFALSLEIREIDPALSWKKNAIHPRLRNS